MENKSALISTDPLFLWFVYDDRNALNAIRDYLSMVYSFKVDTAISWLDALHLIMENIYDAIIADYKMEDMSGINLLKRICHNENDFCFIISTGNRRGVVIGPYVNATDGYVQRRGENESQFAELVHKINTAVNRQFTLLTEIIRHDIMNHVNLIDLLLDVVKKKTDPNLIKYMGKRLESVIFCKKLEIEFIKIYPYLVSNTPQWQCIRWYLNTIISPKNLSLHIDVRNYAIFADPILKKVFENILDIAVRYGKRTINLRVTSKISPENLILIREDGGIGIPLKKKEKIFEKGYGKNTGFGQFFIRGFLSITRIPIPENGIEGEGVRVEIIGSKSGYRFLDPYLNHRIGE